MMPTTDPAASWPNYREGDFVIRDYVFASGESLPELRLHYRTIGVARRDAGGKIINVTSGFGLRAGRNNFIYTSAKAGLPMVSPCKSRLHRRCPLVVRAKTLVPSFETPG